MSRVGKSPIKIPAGVEIKIDGDLVVVRGPKGQLEQKLAREIIAEMVDGEIVCRPTKPNIISGLQGKKILAKWGTTRALINNMIKGVTEGFEKKLELHGVGYRAAVEGDKLVLGLGFSHPVEIKTPSGINFKVEKNVITVSGIDKQLVGQMAAEVRKKRKPEPYKGKGIRYMGEVVRRKAGKKAATAK